ncbi:GCN5-related N-acetyltransferase [uncultured Paludibacter sp.]|nr:GCN5-related N-acetyltransferase [uncultured Paludibacter sp.]
MSFLENEILKLRAVEPEDLELLYKWENNSKLWIAGNTRVPYSKFQLKQYIAQSSYDIFENGHLRLMMQEKATGKTVGTVDLFDFDIHHSRVALGLYVAEEFQGKGFATGSLKLTENYVFNFLKINQLYVQIAENNLASRKLFEGNYELYGYLKNWIKTPEGFENILTYQKFSDNIIR